MHNLSYVEGGRESRDSQMGLQSSRWKVMRENRRFVQETLLGQKVQDVALISCTKTKRGRRKARGISPPWSRLWDSESERMELPLGTKKLRIGSFGDNSRDYVFCVPHVLCGGGRGLINRRREGLLWLLRCLIANLFLVTVWQHFIWILNSDPLGNVYKTHFTLKHREFLFFHYPTFPISSISLSLNYHMLYNEAVRLNVLNIFSFKNLR